MDAGCFLGRQEGLAWVGAKLSGRTDYKKPWVGEKLPGLTRSLGWIKKGARIPISNP